MFSDRIQSFHLEVMETTLVTVIFYAISYRGKSSKPGECDLGNLETLGHFLYLHCESMVHSNIWGVGLESYIS